MKNKLFLFLALFMAHLTLGQVALSPEEVKSLKQKVRRTADATKSVTSDFTQTKHIDVLEREVVSAGKLFYKAPNNIRWEYTSPNPQTIIFKNEMLYVDKNGKTEEIKLSSNKLFKSFNELVVKSIKGNMFDDAVFEISYFNIEDNYLARFKPKERQMKRFVAAFELIFTKNSAEVTEVKLIEPNDDYTVIDFSNRRTNTKIDDKNFKMK